MAERRDGQLEVAYAVGDVVSGTVTDIDDDSWLWLDVGSWDAGVPPQDLVLVDGESARDRYAVGETIEGLFVWDVDHDDRYLRLSIKRNAPGYLEALQQCAVGEVVSGTITHVDDGLWLDVASLVGVIPPWELDLAEGESAQERYVVGETIEDLFVLRVNDKAHDLVLSAKRHAPGYVEALRQRSVDEVVSGACAGLLSDSDHLLDVDDLFVRQIDHEARHISLKRNTTGYVKTLQRHAVGEVVSGTVTHISDDSWLRLNVDGQVGSVAPDELALADGESARERYAVGETIDDLFVLWVNHKDRVLGLSAKHTAPGYMEALQRRVVGDVTSATITNFLGNGGLRLDVGGLVGRVASDELVLADGESARDRYAIGETIEGLFLWQIDLEARHLHLSAKRNAPGYVEALDAIARGDEIDGIVAEANERGVWLGAGGVVGWIPTRELTLDDEELPQTQYTAGDRITARVWQIDRLSRDIILSVRRPTADSFEGPIAQGAKINVTVRGTTPRGIRRPVRVLAADSSVSIPPHALSLSTGTPRAFQDGEEIRAVVVKLDNEGQPTRLSHRWALDGWVAEMQRLSPGALIPNARVMPLGALSDIELRMGSAAADLGPITGFIPEAELDRDSGLELMTYSGNETYRVVIESVDRERRTAIVSHDRFEERWRELAAGFEVGAEVAGELREVEGRVALLDLGAGLMAEMPVEQLSTRAEGDEAEQDWIGETVTVQIKSIETATYTIAAEIKNYDLMQMIAADETLVCELKKVFLVSVQPEAPRARQNRQDVNRSVVRAMAGMMNRDGGHVIVGVEDTDKKDGNVVGWEASGWENQNEMATALSNLVGRVLSAAAGGLYEAQFKRLTDGHEVLDIVCRPADEPIFLSDGQRAEFPVRYPAMTKNLTARDQHEYIQSRFYGREAGA